MRRRKRREVTRRVGRAPLRPVRSRRVAHDLVAPNVLAALALVDAGAGDPHRPRRVPDRARDVRVVGFDVLALDHVTRDLDDRRRDGFGHLARAHLFEHWLEVATALLVPAGGESGASEA